MTAGIAPEPAGRLAPVSGSSLVETLERQRVGFDRN